MAKSGNGSFYFDKFEWNRDGYNELKASQDVRKHMVKRLSAISRAASSASGHTYSYNAVTARIPDLGTVGFVRPMSAAAARDNERNNTLLKSVDAGRL